jgi:hypothetical protein
MGNNEIYILLTHTGSFLSKLIKRYTKEPFSHVSIAFDSDLREVYSFGRKRPRNPLIAGFIVEDIHKGTYSMFSETTYGLYSLNIDDLQYHKLKNTMLEFEKIKQKSSYNLVGLIGVYLGYPINRTYSYFCSQFVACAFEKSGIMILNKPFGLVTPKDFRTCSSLCLVKSGKLSYFNLQENALEELRKIS